MWYNMYTSLLLVTCTAVAVLSLNQPNSIYESWGLTEVQVARIAYTWTIKNFSFCEQKYSEKLISPSFSDGINPNLNWNLVLYPKGKTYSYSEDYISLYLQVNSYIGRAEYKFALLDKNHREIVVGKGSSRFDGRDEMGIDGFVKVNYILNKANGVLDDDQLTIFCEINATIGSENFSGKLKQLSPYSHMVEDLTYLLENQIFSDVTLLANGKEFKAHKAILAMRSVIFQEIFENDPNITQIEITDVDPIVVSEMLRYIYTDQIINLQYLSFDLLDIAVKYELANLKTTCENSIISTNLTVENAAEFFILADEHKADEVKKQAKNLIIAHIFKVIHTSGFKLMIQTHPTLLEEVFTF